jgi:hypothetical protein
VSDVIEEWRTGDVTATMAAVAALLKTLPLDSWGHALGEQVIQDARADEPAYASDTHRRARRSALYAAAKAAREFLSAMQEAMEHNRAVARAHDLEVSADRELATVRGPARSNIIYLPRASRPEYAGLMRIQDEELPHEPA